MSGPINDRERWAEGQAEQHDRGAKYCRQQIRNWIDSFDTNAKFHSSTMSNLLVLAQHAEWHDLQAASLRRARTEREYDEAYKKAANQDTIP